MGHLQRAQAYKIINDSARAMGITESKLFNHAKPIGDVGILTRQIRQIVPMHYQLAGLCTPQ